MAWADCDDNDATSNAIADDADCDGVLAANDCDDNDPALLVKDGQRTWIRLLLVDTQ